MSVYQWYCPNIFSFIFFSKKQHRQKRHHLAESLFVWPFTFGRLLLYPSSPSFSLEIIYSSLILFPPFWSSKSLPFILYGWLAFETEVFEGSIKRPIASKLFSFLLVRRDGVRNISILGGRRNIQKFEREWRKSKKKTSSFLVNLIKQETTQVLTLWVD